MTSTETTLTLEITAAAAAQLLSAMEAQDLAPEDRHLRLFVEGGGGCSGPSFGVAFDRREKPDACAEFHGVTVVVDPVSLPYVVGSTIDFVQTPEVTGFKITAPRLQMGCATSGCGPTDCGTQGGCPPETTPQDSAG